MRVFKCFKEMVVNHNSCFLPNVSSNISPNTNSSLLSDHQCWEILQVYDLTPTTGKLTLKGQLLPY